MLKASTVVNAIVDSLRSIPDLVTALGNDEERIKAFHYIPGVEKNLSQAINTMLQGSILVAWTGTMGGSFDGMTLWKHQIDIYFRVPNQANIEDPMNYENLWWLMMNKPVGEGTEAWHNIRNIDLIPGKVSLMENPTVSHFTDEEGQDYFVGKCVIPELGDQVDDDEEVHGFHTSAFQSNAFA